MTTEVMRVEHFAFQPYGLNANEEGILTDATGMPVSYFTLPEHKLMLILYNTKGLSTEAIKVREGASSLSTVERKVRCHLVMLLGGFLSAPIRDLTQRVYKSTVVPDAEAFEPSDYRDIIL